VEPGGRKGELGRVLLSAPTRDLREFLTKYAASADAFGDDDQMRRKAPAR
jgi:hypothetical protein